MDFQTLLGMAKQYGRDAMPGGLLNPEVPKDAPAEVAKGLLGFTPVVGDAISGYDAVQSATQGNYGEAALNGLGVLPFIPSIAGVTKKQTVEIPTVDALFEALGIQKRKVMADVDFLHRKHPDIFSNSDDVEKHVQYVMSAAPDHVLPATEPRYTLLARDASGMPVADGSPYRGATVDFSGKKQNYWVRNATPLSDLNVSAKKTKSGK